ncbi:MAG: HAMP domain-containing protein [Deltaproteobacteria bacterium]|nr:HAMP domain-containing protein [Deltaproteobacteria bacterium]
MAWKFHIYLNIRQKVMVGLTVCLLAVGFIGVISYIYLSKIQYKQHVVEIADDLSNTILEIRRYEKNYLLYGSSDDIKENQRYVKQGLEVLANISSESQYVHDRLLLKQLETEFVAYRQVMIQMAASTHKIDGHSRQGIEEQLRERGKNLVELSMRVAVYERRSIIAIIRALKTQLISALVIFLGMGLFLVPMVSKKILTPLRVIERTTLKIAQGHFDPLPVIDTRDETQRVVEAFNRMVAELEKRQEQLLQAKKLSSIGILTSGIAHQLNNPLNNISTSCQILLEEFGQMDPDLAHRMLTNVEQEVHRARDIVRGLLEFSRDKKFSLCPACLCDVVEKAVRLMSSHVPPGIEIVRDVPGNIMLQLETQRMQEVFLNLLMNAIQAIAEPPGRITISAKAEPDNGLTAIIVEDTGTGISEADRGKVFDPFFTTKEVGVGTGLGLSIVYGIVREHQGTISVENKPERGCRFIIRLPSIPQPEKE